MSTPTSLLTLTVTAGSAERAARIATSLTDAVTSLSAEGETLTLSSDRGEYDVDVVAASLHTTRQEPTYHGIAYAECFRCGYGTADQITLEAWNDLSTVCPDCDQPGRVLWVLKGGGVHVTESDDMGAVGFSTLRIGTRDNTPPDAPGTITGPELDADRALIDHATCAREMRHVATTRHTEADCRQ